MAENIIPLPLCMGQSLNTGGQIMPLHRENNFRFEDNLVFMDVVRPGTDERFIAKFDVDDFDLVSNRYWSMDNKVLHVISHYNKSGKKGRYMLHRFINGGKHIGFKDGDRLNFCRENLYRQDRRVNYRRVYNRYEIAGETTIMWDSNNRPFLIDTNDLEKLMEYTWRVDYKKGNYVEAHIRGERTSICLHRVIMNALPGEYVDHINHDPSDNRKYNLRICTQSENTHNYSGLRRTNSSGHVGVEYMPKSAVKKRWRAKMRINYNRICAYFETKEEAIDQRKRWEAELNPSGLN